jgi:hypothetical protein
MRFVRLSSISLLAFLGLSAIAGGIFMITGSLGMTAGMMPLSLLKHSPFHSYLIPGIILLTANGLLALCVLFLVVKRRGSYGLWTAFQGCVLLGWLFVECLMLRLVVWPHYLYGVIALGLIVLGLLLRREPDPASTSQR